MKYVCVITEIVRYEYECDAKDCEEARDKALRFAGKNNLKNSDYSLRWDIKEACDED